MTRSLLHGTHSTVHQVKYVKSLGFYCDRIVFDLMSILNPSSFVDFFVVWVVLGLLSLLVLKVPVAPQPVRT